MSEKYIIIKKARVHNLKSIDVKIPREKLVVITGLSGSGKSSLAFDTIYAEGQRRYVESLSTYARQFLGIMNKPEVETIEGLSPAISIAQRKIAKNPRSTVGTVTEIYDYLRLLFARVSDSYCPKCKKKISSYTIKDIIQFIAELPEKNKIMVLAPIIKNKKGSFVQLINKLRKKGYTRLKINNKIYSLDEEIKLKKNKNHNISVIIDRLVTGENLSKQRIAGSVETALKEAEDILEIENITTQEIKFFSLKPLCPDCHITLPFPEPRLFSFNSPVGACSYCGGIGVKIKILPELIVPDSNVSLINGAVLPWGDLQGKTIWNRIKKLSENYNFKVSQPFKTLPEEIKEIIFYGNIETFEGIITNLERRYKQTTSNWIRREIEKYMSFTPCPNCNGERLNNAALSFKINKKTISEITKMSIKESVEFFKKDLFTDPMKKKISSLILKEIKARLNFMIEVGLDYLSLNRKVDTLSGGEDQRVHLATQIGSSLVGVTYVLDEPSIGLHSRDTQKLLKTLIKLKKIGNNVIVVEHDRQIIEESDHIIDLGPGAGKTGGKVVAEGTLKKILKSKFPTGLFLSRKEKIHIPKNRRKINSNFLTVHKASENNLKEINVSFPLQTFICVTGVSGSGKSSLVENVLYSALKKHFYPFFYTKVGKHEKITGAQKIERVININQSPIGRTSRSNPATYTGVFTHIRELFAQLTESKVRGYTASRFSFNVKGGRCEKCQGQGALKIEMHFLPDIYVTCDSCEGKRFNEETLEIHFKTKNIYEILELTVNEGIVFFSNYKDIINKLKVLSSVGLGYLHLGQPAPHLSGGEAQRLKLARELSKGGKGKTLYILDEPTTGLHFADIKILLTVLNKLVDRGDTIIVVEHNMDIIKSSDYIIDLGPEGGDMGGFVVAKGTPEEIIKNNSSITGKYLKKEF